MQKRIVETIMPTDEDPLVGFIRIGSDFSQKLLSEDRCWLAINLTYKFGQLEIVGPEVNELGSFP